jgi:hypothetical protein
MTIIRALISALFIAASAASATSALACSCARNPTAEGLLRDAAAVFTGVAEESRSVAPGVSVTTFRVTEGFKGASEGAIVRVRHPSGSSASCGVQFAPGTSYTLTAHANGSGAGLSASLCSAWMFMPQVGLGDELIARMRVLRRR